MPCHNAKTSSRRSLSAKKAKRWLMAPSWWSLITLLLLVLLAPTLAISLNPDDLSSSPLKSAADWGSSYRLRRLNEDDPTPAGWTRRLCQRLRQPCRQPSVVGLAPLRQEPRGLHPSRARHPLYLRPPQLPQQRPLRPHPPPALQRHLAHKIFLTGNNLSAPSPPAHPRPPCAPNPSDLSNNSSPGSLMGSECKQRSWPILADNRLPPGEIPARIRPALAELRAH
ncbi:hypothetical protein NL676_024395 [Syzygium grande]|nr:hypothetical protein NL676_024395 [Syzygium grande]